MFKFFKSTIFYIKPRFYSLNANPNLQISFLKKHDLITRHNIINGVRKNGKGESFENLNPATGTVICNVFSTTSDELDECIKISSIAQEKWNKVPGQIKAQIMRKAATLVRKQAETIAIVEVLDTGKPLWETAADVAACADTIDMFADLISSIEGNHVSLPGDSFYYTRLEPLGICAGIGAWNYPFQMISWKSAPALAGGNSLLFKPSPMTPLTAVMLAQAYLEAGVQEGLVSVLQGGAELGGLMTRHPGIAKLSFTGGVATGVQIARDAAPSMKRLTLELGGKSPLIVFPDADLNEAARGIVLGNFLSQGQVCSNGTRVFVHSDVLDQLQSLVVVATEALPLGDPLKPGIAVGALISEPHKRMVQKYVESAVASGAQLLCGGDMQFPDDSKLAGGHFMKPCVLTGCRDDMEAVKEEIFGPVAALLSFENEAEVVCRANDSELGLAGGIFTRDLRLAHRVAAQLQVGSVYINNYNVYPPGMPFGGYKKSGIGRENCRQTLFDHFLQTKAVYVEGSLSTTRSPNNVFQWFYTYYIPVPLLIYLSLPSLIF